MLDHEKLDVYQRAIQFFALASKLVAALPRGHSNLADQMKRASLSIPLNIAEGAGKLSGPEKRRFYSIARGSAMECGAILDAINALDLVCEPEIDGAKRELVTIVRMLSKMCGIGKTNTCT